MLIVLFAKITIKSYDVIIQNPIVIVYHGKYYY